MYATPLDEFLAALHPLSETKRHDLLTDYRLTSLTAVFTHLPDPRYRRGRRYSLPFLLTCLVAALLCNCNSTQAFEQWCREQQELLRRVFGPLHHLTPSGSLYRRLLPRLPVDYLEWALAGWVRATRPPGESEPVALDGKTLRGAATTVQAAPHLLSIYTHTTQEVLVQVRVGAKTNEIPVAQALLPLLCWRGRIVTADALHTQVAFVAGVRAQGGHVLLTVKGNQPTLAADLAAYFADGQAVYQVAETIDQHRGRVEQRTLKVTTELTDFLATWSPWVGFAQVGELTRIVTSQGRTRQEVVDVVTTLSPQQACPRCLLRLLRQHWQIEIVQSQMTKTNLFRTGGGRDHIADLYLLVGHNDAINQQLHQKPSLFKGRLGQPVLHPFTECFDRLDQSCQFILTAYTGLQLARLFSQRL